MVTMIEPNYIHYTRLQTLHADQAIRLLAIFELRGREFQTEQEYHAEFEKEYRLAVDILDNAFRYKRLKYNIVDPDAIAFNEFGVVEISDFSLVTIKVADFCSWAIDLNYNLPDVLAKLARNLIKTQEPEGEQIVRGAELPAVAPTTEMTEGLGVKKEIGETNETKPTNDTTSQKGPKKTGKGGPKKCTLSLAVEVAYLKLLRLGDTKVLMPGMRDAFMECFKEMASHGNRNSDEGVLELIKEVRKSKQGKYTIITQDRPNKTNPKKIEELSGEYGTSQVTRFLNMLRSNHPLPPK